MIELRLIKRHPGLAGLVVALLVVALLILWLSRASLSQKHGLQQVSVAAITTAA
jgi:hypothetical protein